MSRYIKVHNLFNNGNVFACHLFREQCLNHRRSDKHIIAKTECNLLKYIQSIVESNQIYNIIARQYE